MSELNLPAINLKIILKEGKKYVFDRLRKQYVRFTPEEEVRQRFIHLLIEHKHYPEGLLANEVCIEYGAVNRRCDTVLYDRMLNPRMIIEFKAPSIVISQNTFDQIIRYTMSLPAPWLIISNGLVHFCCIRQGDKYVFVKDVPDYSEL